MLPGVAVLKQTIGFLGWMCVSKPPFLALQGFYSEWFKWLVSSLITTLDRDGFLGVSLSLWRPDWSFQDFGTVDCWVLFTGFREINVEHFQKNLNTLLLISLHRSNGSSSGKWSVVPGSPTWTRGECVRPQWLIHSRRPRCSVFNWRAQHKKHPSEFHSAWLDVDGWSCFCKCWDKTKISERRLEHKYSFHSGLNHLLHIFSVK